MASAALSAPRRWLRRLAWCAAGLGLLLGLAAWGVPALLVWQLPLRLSEALGRPVSLQGASFVPWRLELGLQGLRIDAAVPGEPLLQLDRLQANLGWSSLRHRAPVVDALSLDGLRLHLTRTAPGHYDIDDLIARLGQPSPPAGRDEPARFALYNLSLREGQLHFDDRPAGQQHTVQALTLTLPFLSNLPADVAVHTEPRLAFTLNGTRLDSGSRLLPFAETRTGEFKLAFADLDLKPWLGYLPASLPLRLRQARLSSDLALRFALPPQRAPEVSLQGQLGLHDVALSAPDGTPLASWQTLALGLRDVQPLQRRIALDALQIDGATLQLARDARGQINLQRLFAAPDTPPAAAPAAPAAAPWQLSLAELRLNAARLHWNDDAVKPQAALQLDALTLRASALRWPAPAALPVSLSATLRSQRAGAGPVAQLAAEGQVHDQAATLSLSLSALDLDLLAPYLAQALRPQVSGRLALTARLRWSADAAAPALAVTLDTLQLDDLLLRDGLSPRAARLASLKQLRLGGAEFDAIAHRIGLGQVTITQPTLALARDADGRLNLLQWAAAGPDAARPAARAPAPPAERPWQVGLQGLSVDGGQLGWSDAAVTGGHEPLRLEIGALRLRLQALDWPPRPRVAGPQLQLSARVGAPARPGAPAEAGRVDWRGRIDLAPAAVDGQLTLAALPLHLLAPYAGDSLPVHLAHAEGGFQGRVRARQAADGWQVNTEGRLQLNGLQVLTRAADGDAIDSGHALLSWQTLALDGLQLSLQPAHKPRLEVREAVLTDFYSQLVITEQGHFNLQDVARPAAAASAPEAPAPPPAATAASATPATPAEGATGAADTGLPVTLVLGGMQLRNGRVDFTDHFIRPNYSARLTELNGQIGALRSDTREMATISLRGRAADTALLDISGQLNPTAQPLALDIHARATDLELAPLSPYAGKYAGYAIERGKLSVDVAYKIDADGRLAASNQLVLNQLTFGDKVDSPSATKLPVLLAVALLKDRHGDIDINLPISGSLSDPQFSVGGIIWKLILNLIGKALTAPFALLGGGGGPDLSQVAFLPGTAQLADDASTVLDKVAQALQDRPALTMTVTGMADPVAEHDAALQAALDGRLLAERRRLQLRGGAAAPADVASAAPPTGDERSRLLKALYQQTPLPAKPRNLVGLLRDLPEAEMAARLKAAIPVTDDTMRDLALQRGLAVRDALAARGLPTARLFVGAPRLQDAGDAARPASAPDAGWTPRVTLTLALP